MIKETMSPCLKEELPELNRRQFMKHGISMTAWLSLSQLFFSSRFALAQTNTSEVYSVKRRLVWINMSGGWDTLETVDPKPASTSGIDVAYAWNLANTLKSSNDVRVGRWMPGLASLGDDVLLLRGLAMGTTSHDAGPKYMDTGILSNNGRVNAASIPAIVSSHAETTIPFIQLQGGMTPTTDRGLLKSISVVRAENLQLYRSMYPTTSDMSDRQLNLIKYLNNSLAAERGILGDTDRTRDVEAALSKIEGQIKANVADKLQLTTEDQRPFQAAATASGSAQIGQGGSSFALALKLLKNDLVTSINMGVGGFDTHSNQDRNLQPILQNFDRNLKVFVDELKSAKMLDTTLIVLYSDFARTPKINNTNGRDHWPVGGAIMIGGGIAGGRAVGGTDDNYLAKNVNLQTGVLSDTGEQINPTHLGGSVLDLTLGSSYLSRRPYLYSVPALTKLKT